MATVFEGLKVMDFSQGMAGSLATMILADNGAEVVKVEPPDGDPYRWMPAWVMWNRGKKSAVIDLDTATGRETALGLARHVDVVLESFIPGMADRMGIGYDALSESNPGLVYCSITGLGSKGAYKHLPAYEGIVQAKAGGFVEIQTFLQRDVPTYRVRPNGSYGAANLAVQAIAAALRVRDTTGKGQRVETSLFQGYTCYDHFSVLPRQAEMGLMTNPPPARSATRGRQTTITYLVVRCKDGQWMQMTNNALRLFPVWMKALGLEHIHKDPRFEKAPASFPTDEDRLLLRRMILEKSLEKTLDEWLEIFIEKGVAGDRFLSTQQFMDYPQTLHNQGVIDLEDPTVGPTRQIGPLVRFEKSPSVTDRPAPLLGQHTVEVVASAKAMASPSRTGSSQSAAPKHPFEGLTVLDFSAWLASPFGPSLMADLGARVIKVEALGGDEFRPMSQGRGRTFQGKESLVVDLKNPNGRKVIHALIARADGLVHNMRGDAAERLGIDYDTVRKINPRLVYLYAGSYGSSGPGAGRGAFHPTAGALSGGALWQLGKGNEPPPNDEPLDIEEITGWSERLLRANEGSPDVTSAIAAGTALAMGLYHRERTGEGQYLETSMLNSNGYICSEDFISYRGKPPRMEPDKHLRGVHALQRLYRAADGWLFLACPTQAEWEALCLAIGKEELAADPRFSDHTTRLKYDDHLIAVLGRAFQSRGAQDWESYLAEKGVACVRADEQPYTDFFLTDPSVRENGFIVTTDHPVTGTMMRQGPPAQFSATPGRAEPAHIFGEDTVAILQELGFPQEEIQRLKAERVIAYPEPAAI